MRVITAVSGKGGVGKTTTVANLGVALAHRGQRVLLLDCNLLNPDLRIHLGVSGFPVSLQEVLLLDMEPGRAAVSAWGADLIPAVPGFWKQLEPLPRWLRGLRGRDAYDVVLVDTSPGVVGWNAEILEASDLALLVSTPDPAAEADTRRIATRIPAPVLPVVNRSTNGHVHRVPRVGAWQGMGACLDAGVPLAARSPESPAAREYARLAKGLLRRSAPEAPRTGSGPDFGPAIVGRPTPKTARGACPQ